MTTKDTLSAIFGDQLPEGATSFSTWNGVNGFTTSFLIGATGKFIDVAMTQDQIDAMHQANLVGTFGIQIK